MQNTKSVSTSSCQQPLKPNLYLRSHWHLPWAKGDIQATCNLFCLHPPGPPGKTGRHNKKHSNFNTVQQSYCSASNLENNNTVRVVLTNKNLGSAIIATNCYIITVLCKHPVDTMWQCKITTNVNASMTIPTIWTTQRQDVSNWVYLLLQSPCTTSNSVDKSRRKCSTTFFGVQKEGKLKKNVDGFQHSHPIPFQMPGTLDKDPRRLYSTIHQKFWPSSSRLYTIGPLPPSAPNSFHLRQKWLCTQTSTWQNVYCTKCIITTMRYWCDQSK